MTATATQVASRKAGSSKPIQALDDLAAHPDVRALLGDSFLNAFESTMIDGVRIHRNGFQGAVHLCAQRWWDGLLVGVLRCSACGVKWRLETLADVEPAAVALRSEADRLGATSQAGWYHTVADRLLAGYRPAGIDTGGDHVPDPLEV